MQKQYIAYIFSVAVILVTIFYINSNYSGSVNASEQAWKEEITKIQTQINTTRTERKLLQAKFYQEDASLSGTINQLKDDLVKIEDLLSACIKAGKCQKSSAFIPNTQAYELTTTLGPTETGPSLSRGFTPTDEEVERMRMDKSTKNQESTNKITPITSSDDTQTGSDGEQEGKTGTPQQDTYWIAYEQAIGHIQKWEGLRLKAYHDYGACSIGYGSRAKNCYETITIEEANNRLAGTVRSLVNTVQKDFPTLEPNKQAALVSFAYNCHKGYRDAVRNGLKQHKFWCKTAGGKVLPGLVQRRANEAQILFK